MAVDSEQKRWSMLALSSGAVPSHVFNPETSGLSSIEKITVLQHYGGISWEGPDVTAPILSNPTGVATGPTTATGTVDTDEAGTLFFFASTNSSESAATIKASGESQAATTGTQNVSFTGLTAGTEFFAHYVEDDAENNESNVVSSAGFETDSGIATGWKFLMDFDRFREKREEDEEERERVKEEVEAIESPVDKEIAQLLQQDIEAEDRAKEIKALELLITENATPQDLIAAEAHNVAKAFARAAIQKNFSAVEALERELDREREESEFLMLALVLLH